LDEKGESNDNVTVFGLLRKLQILIYDFTADHTQANELVNERCANVLHTDDKKNASKLWDSLVAIAQHQGACGGSISRDQLISEIRKRKYRLAGEREYATSRRVIAEWTALSLKAIPDKILDIHLPRSDYLQAIRGALKNQRYIEIRGEAGVGKSAVLKHLALQASEQSVVILLSPKRTPGRGWLNFQSAIRFDATARELLVDLESSGGGTLFIDNLDFFTEDEQTTVIDLIRTAADIDSFFVITTARHNFGQEESNWLPLDELDRLGVAEPIVIDELSDTEIDQIRIAAPMLEPLLEDSHPARAVVRNLFKLSQLVEHSIESNDIITEVDMAVDWWDKIAYVKTKKRECGRLLTSLAEKSLESNKPIDVRNNTTTSIDALIENDTISDGGLDHVTFRHDIFTDWAISNLLYSYPKNLALVPMNHFPPPWLERSIELLARMHLEKDDDVTKWLTLLEQTGLKDNHNRWRRAVLLAIVRSENATKMLVKLASTLLSNSASLLRELMKAVQSVEVIPLRNSLMAPIKETSFLPKNFTIPIKASWVPLIVWLIYIKDRLPPDAIADVVDIYTSWSVGLFASDPLTPLISEQLYLWLMEIESTDEQLHLSNGRGSFNRDLINKRPKVSRKLLQYSFFSICHRKPDLASQYLKTLLNRNNNRREIEDVLKFSGSLAQAAPAELAELTLNSLIERLDSKWRNYASSCH